MTEIYIIIMFSLFVTIYTIRYICISIFKISYYESELEHHGVDIKVVKNINFRGIFK